MAVSVLPQPTGSCVVGCVDICSDSAPLIRIYYPTNDRLSQEYSYAKWSPHTNYMPSYWSLGRLKFPTDISQEEVSKRVDSVTVPALYGAPLKGGEDQCPVIVLSHGRCSMRTRYSAFCCELASHGYIVAVPEHCDGSACVALNRKKKVGTDQDAGNYEDEWIPYYERGEGETEYELRTRQIKKRIKELGATKDLIISLGRGVPVNIINDSSKFDFCQFKGRVNEDAFALVGHSFGSATLLQAFYDGASTFKCGIAMDPWMMPLPEELLTNGLKQPVLFINSALYYQTPQTVSRILKLLKPPDEATGISSSQLITIDGTVHVSQSDTIFVLGEYQLDNNKPLLSPKISFKVNMSLCRAFLNRYLLKLPEYQSKITLLDGGGEQDKGEHNDCIIYGTNVVSIMIEYCSE